MGIVRALGVIRALGVVGTLGVIGALGVVGALRVVGGLGVGGTVSYVKFRSGTARVLTVVTNKATSTSNAILRTLGCRHTSSWHSHINHLIVRPRRTTDSSYTFTISVPAKRN